jgi:hypothetical protein
MKDEEDRYDIVNKNRFLDVVCGESALELGLVTGTYKNQPCELLVMVNDHDVSVDADKITVIPLAIFISEEDINHLDIPSSAEIEVIEFNDNLPTPEECALNKNNYKKLLN